MTATTVKIVVPGAPEGQRRHRAVAYADRIRIHDDPRNLAYADRIRWAWHQAGSPRFGRNPVQVTIYANHKRPQGHWTTTGRLSANGERHPHPTRKPDWDNVGKACADALNGLAWADDACIVDGRVIKAWAPSPADEACVVILATGEIEEVPA